MDGATLLSRGPGPDANAPGHTHYTKPGASFQTRRERHWGGAATLLYLIPGGPVMPGLLDKGRPTADDPPP
jgi:hypothetical protein